MEHFSRFVRECSLEETNKGLTCGGTERQWNTAGAKVPTPLSQTIRLWGAGVKDQVGVARRPNSHGEGNGNQPYIAFSWPTFNLWQIRPSLCKLYSEVRKLLNHYPWQSPSSRATSTTAKV